MPVLNLTHQVTYDLKGNAVISDVANSLVANEKLIKLSCLILEDCIPGFKIESIDVKLKRVLNESPLTEMLGYALVMVYQKELIAEVPPIVESILHTDIPHKYDTIVTIVAMLLVIHGIEAFYKRIFPAKKPESAQKDYTQLITVAGDLIQVPSSKIDEKVKERFSKGLKILLQKTALDFIKPARREKGVKIYAPDGSVISSATIQEVPKDTDLFDEELEQIPMQNVEIEIRAIDKDRKKQGWAAVIKDATEKRLRVEVYPTIDAKKIYGKDKIRGDIILVNKKDEGGEYKPHMYNLIKVYDDDDTQGSDKKGKTL